MAGYSGGRKLICPGIAALETVKVWHGPRFPRTSQGRLRHPRRQPGPRGEHLDRPAWPAAISSSTSCIDGQRRPLTFVAGDMEAGLSRRRRVRPRAWSSTRCAEPVDIVVTSCAGYPLDTTFYQAVKGLTGALPIVKQGGTIILAASLTEGIGSPEFQQLFARTRPRSLHRADPGQGLLRDGPVAARRAGQGAPQGQGENRQRRHLRRNAQRPVRRTRPQCRSGGRRLTGRISSRQNRGNSSGGMYLRKSPKVQGQRVTLSAHCGR